MSVSEGRGIDIVLASLGSSRLANLWYCLARNGRFILTGGGEMPDLSTFDASIFTKGATFSSSDILEMISKEPVETSNLIRKVLAYYWNGHLLRLPAAKKFDIAEFADAVQIITRGPCYGQVVLDCGPDAVVPVIAPAREQFEE
jgi:NADPH:quinone reductase-like Zn-dependent oxidoreductase